MGPIDPERYITALAPFSVWNCLPDSIVMANSDVKITSVNFNVVVDPADIFMTQRVVECKCNDDDESRKAINI